MTEMAFKRVNIIIWLHFIYLYIRAEPTHANVMSVVSTGTFSCELHYLCIKEIKIKISNITLPDIVLMAISASTASTTKDCCQNVEVKSSHDSAANIIGSYTIDAGSLKFYKQNKASGNYLFMSEDQNKFWKVSNEYLYAFVVRDITFK